MSKKDKNKNEMHPEEEVLTQDQQVNSENESDDQIESPMEKLQEEYQLEKDRYLRLFAEFENYKKRTGRERIELFKTAGEDVIKSLLPVMDDFDRALNEIEKAKDDDLYTGVQLISNKFRETLRAKGLVAMDTQQGDVFDADVHEAVTQIPAPSEDLKGKIIDVLEKGYTLGDKIIRFPKVVIGQ